MWKKLQLLVTLLNLYMIYLRYRKRVEIMNLSLDQSQEAMLFVDEVTDDDIEEGYVDMNNLR